MPPSYDPETREGPDDKAEIELSLLHKHYMSQKDIDTCRKFDIDHLANHDHHAEIKVLYDAFTALYPPNDN